MKNPADEIKRLQSCINDLISVLALPAMWTGREPSDIVGTLLDVLVTMLRLDFASVRLSDSSDGPPIEVSRFGDRQHEGDVSTASFSLGLQHHGGTLVAGSRRADFPTDVERLLLRVAANQAAIGLQEARRSGEQKRVAEALEQRVGERTRQLTAANEELEKAFDEIKRSEDRLRLVIDTIPGLVWRGLPDGSFDFINQPWLNYLGCSWDELSARGGLESALHPDDVEQARARWAATRASGHHTDHELRMRRADGQYRWFLTRALPWRDGQGNIVRWYGTAIDIEDRKRAEEARQQTQSDLARVSRVTTMGELTASLAHEVNQPIAASLLNAGSCVRWLGADPPNLEEARAAALRIVNDGTRAKEIISRIRMFFEKGPPQREPVDVNELIRGMIMLLHNETTRHAILVRTELAVDLPAVTGDRVQLQQVVMNLLMNGIEAMKDIDGARELVIQSERAEDGHLLVSVRDTGVGLPPQHADQIFSAFVTTKVHGTGMGLSISRSILESHDGRLWAAANAPRGASFFFTLPIRSVEAQASRTTDAARLRA